MLSATRRVVFWLAVVLLVVGVAIAFVIPPSYGGRCSVTTEFTCGYRARTGFKWLVALASLGVGVPLLIWAKGRMTKQIGFWVAAGVVVAFIGLGVFMIFATILR